MVVFWRFIELLIAQGFLEETVTPTLLSLLDDVVLELLLQGVDFSLKFEDVELEVLVLVDELFEAGGEMALTLDDVLDSPVFLFYLFLQLAVAVVQLVETFVESGLHFADDIFVLFGCFLYGLQYQLLLFLAGY